ncbi:MAG: 3-isopropylmalate dehydratase small subunit [Deltaproteobacteria bacterium]|nr:3-isopropylmalate dehydratase small subunit [Deltaproteobacteria bacterium]
MEKFETHSGKAALLKRENIDTDQIIPKEYLKSIKRTGFDKGLFAYWRFDDQGNLKDDFALNQPKNLGATILLVGNNFGCGSSREHAVWALQQFGFKVIIAPTKEQNGQVIPGFADIFRSNSGKNGLLLIELAADSYEQLVQAFQKSMGTLNIDLPNKS